MKTMKKYIRPAIKVEEISTSNFLLTGSLGMDTSEDPATDPALSREATILYNEEGW